ncbi:DUF1189 family protein [Candidatus Roizmanbacteria bacterium]|nr:DUF1189 family protein [Candidatus Roizmanbacteria bacterium]
MQYPFFRAKPVDFLSSFSSSFKYFLAMLFVFNMVFVTSIFIRHDPKKINTILSAFSLHLAQYPQDLTVSIKKGKLITNYNRPYLLWLDYEDKKNLFLVIDETATPKKIQLYKSFILLTSSELVVNDTKTRSFSTLPLSYINDQKVTKEKVNQFVNGIDAIRSLFPLVYIAVVFFFLTILPIASLIVTFLYLLFSSCVVFAVYRFFAKKHFKFKRILQVSFHAVTLPLLLDYTLIILRPTIKMNPHLFTPLRQIPFPILFIIILSFFVAAGVYEAHADEVKESHKKTHHIISHSSRS